MLFLNYVYNELYKTLSTKILIIFSVVLLTLASLLTWVGDDSGTDDNEGWIELLISENNQLEERLESDDFQGSSRIRTHFFNRIQENNYRIENNIPFSSGLANMRSVSNLIALLELMLVIVIARMIATEFEKKTIYNLIIESRSRSLILFSKLVAGVFIIGLLIIYLIGMGVLVTTMRHGMQWLSHSDVMTLNGVVQEVTVLHSVGSHFLLSLPQVILTFSITFFLSFFTRNSIISSAVPVFLSFFGTIIEDIVSPFSWGVIWPYLHTNMIQHVSGNPHYQNLTIYHSIAIVLCLCISLISISFYQFSRLDV